MYEKQEIEAVLAEGRIILDERPELKLMSVDAILDELNDGTEEMIHNRWGVAAWIVVDSIKDMKFNVLVEHLASNTSGLLTDNYVGYLLQKEYNINLELLILEADKCGKYEKIVFYVLENLQYQEKYKSDNLLPILEMLEHHSHDNVYSQFLHYYSKYIMKFGALKKVADTIHELKTQAQYDLMCRLKHLWYQEDMKQANEQLSFYASQQGAWNKKLVVEFIEESLYYDISIFEQYLPSLKVMSQENSDLWNQLIPVFVEYVQLKEHEEPLGNVIKQVLQDLKRIPDDTEKTKQVFIAAFVRFENCSEHLSNIYREIISRPFADKHIPYDLIDYYYYRLVKNGLIKQSMQELQTIFRVNDISTDYSSFFDGFSSTFSEIANVLEDTTKYSLNYMLSNKLDQVFFGIGLFVKIGNLENYLSKTETEKIFLTDVQLVRVMKGLLYYYIIDSKFICRTAFQLLALSRDECTQFFQFCMEDVYANYPFTLCEISFGYMTTGNEKQNSLAKLIKKEYEQLLDEQANVRGVKDLQPSYEHQLIYRKVKMIQTREISKKANEQSVFGQLFPSRIIKYGVRNAHIVKLSKNQKQVRESEYQHITHEMELPMIYVHNPVEFVLKRMSYIEEVKNDAADN